MTISGSFRPPLLFRLACICTIALIVYLEVSGSTLLQNTWSVVIRNSQQHVNRGVNESSETHSNGEASFYRNVSNTTNEDSSSNDSTSKRGKDEEHSIQKESSNSDVQISGKDLLPEQGSSGEKSVVKETPVGKTDSILERETAVRNMRYLLPVEYYNSGPNYLYRNFKIASIVAAYLNRIIVEISFPRHFSQGKGLEEDIRPFNTTFDVEQFNEALPTISLENFKHKCNNSVDAILLPPRTIDVNMAELFDDYEKHRLIFQKLYGIILPKESKDKNESLLYPLGSDSAIDDIKCLAIFSIRHFLRVEVPNIDRIKADIDKNLIRSKDVRDAAEHVMSSMCDGKPYLAIHWRNKSAEGCRFGKQCGQMNIVELVNENAKNVVNDIRVLQKQYNLSCIYVAYPPYAVLFIEILRNSSIPNVFDNGYILNDNNPELEIYKQDDYMMSLLEQEICFQADVFLGWRLSDWTIIIQRCRNRMENKTLTIEIQNLPSWKDE